MSTKANPGIDVLRLFSPWLTGMRLVAGECLLSRGRPVMHLVAEPCPVDGCRWLMCAPSAEELAERRAAHRIRVHGGAR